MKICVRDLQPLKTTNYFDHRYTYMDRDLLSDSFADFTALDDHMLQSTKLTRRLVLHKIDEAESTCEPRSRLVIRRGTVRG